MALFSQRKGIHPIMKPFQTASLDEETRNQIWSILYLMIFKKYHPEYPYSQIDANAKRVESFLRAIWTWYLKYPADSLEDPTICIHTIKGIIFDGVYFEVLDLIEWIIKNYVDSDVDKIKDAINHLLQRESCGFRIVNEEIVEITSEEEIKEIEKASETISPYSTHLKRALELLADKKSPDYRNSAKESISAVEAICREVCRNDKATLGDALKKLRSEIAVNPVFQSAMSKLYGFVSDDGGIRHSLLESSSVINYSDAKYFLVSCSAFVNYINELR